MDQLSIYILAAENPEGKPQRRIFKRKRAGEVLTREQVKAIKKGRKLLRKQMKAKGLKEKSDFELTAANMSLYFDKRRFFLWLLWFFKGKGLLALLLATLLMLLGLFAFSSITQRKGHFTINMTDDMFKEGFVLSETADFANPTTHLFCTPAEDVPCISISHLEENIDDYEGQHNADYFAYTFFCRNEGESIVDYSWEIAINSESKNLSEAAWVMVFEDGEMAFYAEPDSATGGPQALPAFDDNSRGYIGRPLEQFCKDPEAQYETVKQSQSFSYERVIPINFLSEDLVAAGEQKEVAPMDVHKYTVVIWLEGDDPDCTNEMIGGHLGLEFNMRLSSETAEEAAQESAWQQFWSSLKFWE